MDGNTRRTVLFCSSRPLGRCENITAVWDVYDGPKDFAQIRPNGDCPEAVDSRYGAIVSDEFLKAKADGASLVMIGHGIDGGKLYGLDQKVRYYTSTQTGLIDYYITGSRATRQYAASSAGISPECCLALGMPRTDAYVDKRKGDGGTFLAGYTAYLFVPTIRVGWEPKAPSIDWEAVNSSLDEGEILVVKRHMMSHMETHMEFSHMEAGHMEVGRLARIFEVDPMEPSTPYLIDCDVVITDYSSIILDGYILGKPGALFCPDRAVYLSTRGMYRPYPFGYASIAADDPRGMVPAARYATEHEEVDSYRELFASACDGHSTQRVCELVRSIL